MEIINSDPIIDELVKSTGSDGSMPTAELRCHPEGWMLNKHFAPFAEKIKNFKVRPDDVWILSYPKCGTTWCQEMLWLLNNNCDLETANSSPLYSRAPFLEFHAICAEGNKIPDTVDVAAALPSPRVIKSHLPPDLLPTEIWTVKPKIVYVYRNPKDAAISYFHHYRLWNEYTGTRELFLEAFLQDKLMFSPFWKHVLSYWNLRNHSFVKFITYDDMKKDLLSVMKGVAAHMGVTIPENRVNDVLDHLSFQSMNKNPMVNFEEDRKEIGKLDQHFFRKGESGQWKKALTQEEIARFDDWSNSFIKKTDFPHYY